MCYGVNRLLSSEGAFTYAVSKQFDSNHGALSSFGVCPLDTIA